MTKRTQLSASTFRLFAFGLLCGSALLPSGGCETDGATYLDPLDMAVAQLPDASNPATGLPCDVSKVLASNCLACHATAQGPSKLALATYDDLVAASRSNPAKKVVEVSVQRMQDPARPMPPSGLPPAADAKVLQDWINAGLPKGSCGGDKVDAGSDAGGGGDGGTGVVCTSGTTWMGGNKGSSSMYPGKACITCHATVSGAPTFQIAGTVYPTAHEPDSCNGTGGGGTPISVEIIGADGTVFPLTVNSVGNFTYRPRTSSIKLPYTAQVKQGTKTRAMKSSQMNGDCNTCHSQDGASGAPGRIMAP
ncbi:MAG TPA: hypothetical protein PKO07_23675 [Pseudomonadota bacterium]|nr:hypothetical protein [Pseudomonadota bacterium]HNN54051.1 hypothetical protein [Pseudomonadota bacterium]